MNEIRIDEYHGVATVVESNAGAGVIKLDLANEIVGVPDILGVPDKDSRIIVSLKRDPDGYLFVEGWNYWTEDIQLPTVAPPPEFPVFNIGDFQVEWEVARVPFKTQELSAHLDNKWEPFAATVNSSGSSDVWLRRPKRVDNGGS